MERTGDAELTSRSPLISALLSRITGQKTVRQLLEDERRSPIPMLDDTKGSYGYSGVYVLARLSHLEGFAGVKSFRISEGYPKVFTTGKGVGGLF
jgi:hypothetical protein